MDITLLKENHSKVTYIITRKCTLINKMLSYITLSYRAINSFD